MILGNGSQLISGVFMRLRPPACPIWDPGFPYGCKEWTSSPGVYLRGYFLELLWGGHVLRLVARASFLPAECAENRGEAVAVESNKTSHEVNEEQTTEQFLCRLCREHRASTGKDFGYYINTIGLSRALDGRRVA